MSKWSNVWQLRGASSKSWHDQLAGKILTVEINYPLTITHSTKKVIFGQNTTQHTASEV